MLPCEFVAQHPQNVTVVDSDELIESVCVCVREREYIAPFLLPSRLPLLATLTGLGNHTGALQALAAKPGLPAK